MQVLRTVTDTLPTIPQQVVQELGRQVEGNRTALGDESHSDRCSTEVEAGVRH